MDLKPSLLVVNRADSSNQVNEKVNVDKNVFRFTPLQGNSASVPSSTPAGSNLNNEKPASSLLNETAVSSSPADFVFGSNLEERVLLPTKGDETEENKSSTKSEESTSTVSSTTSSTNLPEKRKYEVITGEEDELNVLQILCKLYYWDNDTSTWKEKGKGWLKLNDKFKDDKVSSRLIMRNSGLLKVVLNVAIVPGMKFDLSREDCLRFTDISGIYLVKGKIKDIEQIHAAIDSRLHEAAKRIRTEKSDEKNNSSEADGKDDRKSKDESSEKETVKSKHEEAELPPKDEENLVGENSNDCQSNDEDKQSSEIDSTGEPSEKQQDSEETA